MTDDHHTPEGADGLRRTVANLLATHQIPTDLVASPGGNFKTKWTDNWEDCTDAVMALIAAEVHASNRRLLDAVEGVIGEDEKQPDNEPYMATRIDPYAYQRNKLRAELRAALKGLREGNDAYVRKVRGESGQSATPSDAQAQGHEADNQSESAPERSL